MIHIHPFPARMAPEIALKGLEDLPPDSVVLDPMTGSGMVVGMASKRGIKSIGYDLDPLACLISRTNGTSVNPETARQHCANLLKLTEKLDSKKVSLPWIDCETQKYIDFWFAKTQQYQLRALIYLLNQKPFTSDKKYINILNICVSRLIITKEPKASLARDTAHSRPHRTITENHFNVFEALPKSLEHVLSALQPERIQIATKTFLGDARRMQKVADCSIDCIVTLPPYLNAIDYMRGHRLSLVWLGYSVSKLRKIRARSVGAEVTRQSRKIKELKDFLTELHEEADGRKRCMLKQYYCDLCALTAEARRVLKPNCTATYVIGNSNIKGHKVDNARLLVMAAQSNGFVLQKRNKREIPENRRYMPLQNSVDPSMSKRIRSEHILVFEKLG